MSYVEQTRVSAASPAAVRVMTIHQSKGLEFDAVFLPELESGLIGQPDAFVIDRQDGVGPVRTRLPVRQRGHPGADAAGHPADVRSRHRPRRGRVACACCTWP